MQTRVENCKYGFTGTQRDLYKKLAIRNVAWSKSVNQGRSKDLEQYIIMTFDEYLYAYRVPEDFYRVHRSEIEFEYWEGKMQQH